MFAPLAILFLAAPRELNVFAAASLRESFQAISHRFEASHRDIHVHVEFAGSQDLAAQINQGAPADVFASASPKDLDLVAYDPSTRRIFASNRLVVACPSGRTGYAFHDLSHADKIVLAAPAVPAGGYARKAIDAAARRFGAPWRAAVLAHVVSEEVDVRAVLTKVELAEADAGIVYGSDAAASGGRVRAAPIPAEFQPKILYPVAVLRHAAQPGLATEFVRLLMSSAGQSELRRRGFVHPPIER